jgi:hypothetical protein
MNKQVPYVWRKNYCTDERRSQNFPKIAHEKVRQYLSTRCYIVSTSIATV